MAVAERLVIVGDEPHEERRKHGYEVRLIRSGECVGGGTIIAPNSGVALGQAREYSRQVRQRIPHDDVALDRVDYITTRRTLARFTPEATA